jgi:hypothetical protein
LAFEAAQIRKKTGEMAQTLTMQASEAGPSGFHDSEDFIAFDFDDNGDDEPQIDEVEAEEVVFMGSSREASRDANVSSKANGKKRKVDEGVELEGKSKREKKRELARGTPWCVDVDFESCLNQADV